MLLNLRFSGRLRSQLSTPVDPLTYYTITILDAADPLAVTAEISSTAIGPSSPYNAIFSMAYEGLDYKIVTLQVDWNGDTVYDIVID